MLPGDRGKIDPDAAAPDLTGEQLMQVSTIAHVIFIVICLLFGFSYHDAANEIHTIIFIGSVFLLMIMYQSWRTYSESSMNRASFIVSSWFFVAVVTGTWVGLFSFNCCIGEYWTVQKLESRQNVLPSEPAGAYANAGGLIFADEARVDPSKSVGFKDINVFCVAPVASDAPMDTVQFWAAGVDCCGARGSFVCDDAWNPKAHGGLVIRNGSFSVAHEDIYSQYMKAVKLAEVTYSIASAKEPIFVRWVEDPNKVELNMWRAGLGVLLACIIVSALGCGLTACGCHVVLNRNKNLAAPRQNKAQPQAYP